MQNILLKLEKSVAEVVDIVQSASKALFINANRCKEDYIEALVALKRSNGHLVEMSRILAKLDEIAQISKVCDEAIDNINTITETAEYFCAPVEQFIGVCNDCGTELVRNEPYDYVKDAGETLLICESCAEARTLEKALTDSE